MKAKLWCLFVWTIIIGIVMSGPCYDENGNAILCLDTYSDVALRNKTVLVTNTCGIHRRQEYCIYGNLDQKCQIHQFCNSNNRILKHTVDYLFDGNKETWWQSETRADNPRIGKTESVNITIDLGGLHHVNKIYLVFKSPLPSAMVIYKKIKSTSEWIPWAYFANDCMHQFYMTSWRYMQQIHLKYGTGSTFSISDPSCDDGYHKTKGGSIIIFSIFNLYKKADNFFSDPKIMEQSTASLIRIELKRISKSYNGNDKDILSSHYFAISSIEIEARCWCHGHGGKCVEYHYGNMIRCSCSHNTKGRFCESCQDFFNDAPWKPATNINVNPCKKCNCNENSQKCKFDMDTYIKSGNKSGGICIDCEDETIGKNCELCKTGFFKSKLKPIIRKARQDNKTWTCIPCNCDPIGSKKDSCDDQGNCICKSGVTGKKCTRCRLEFYGFGLNGCRPCNCYLDGTLFKENDVCNSLTGACHCKDNVNGVKCHKCRDGYFQLRKNDPLGCQPCYCFARSRQCKIAKNFFSIKKIESIFENDVDDWYYLNENGEKLTPYIFFTISGSSGITWFKGRDDFGDNIFLYAPKKFLGDRQFSYNLHLNLYLSFRGFENVKYKTNKMHSINPDVELISGSLAVGVPFVVSDQHPALKKDDTGIHLYQYILNEKSGGWRGKLDHYQFNALLSNLTAIRIRIANPDGYILVHRVVLENSDIRYIQTYGSNVNVENCTCPAAYTGISCKYCEDGYYRQTPSDSPFVRCIKCFCNNQTDMCDKLTGKCICFYNTVGKNCEMCKPGFYGDPTTNIRNHCKPCGCPFGASCIIKGSTVTCTKCFNHTSGAKCDRCEKGYYGDPLNGVKCKKCNCHGNTLDLDNCDPKTGKCSDCLFNSTGDYCEKCLPGCYLNFNERGIKRCSKCNCDMLTGKCPCKPLMSGENCDVCQEGFYYFNGTPPCIPCNCSIGSYNKSCTNKNGQCNCLPGVSGYKCDKCMPGFFDFEINLGCKPCNCNSIGSNGSLCSVDTGQCKCKLNVVGRKCDKCKENFYDFKHGCKKCHDCYTYFHHEMKRFRQNFMKVIQNHTKVTEQDLPHSYRQLKKLTMDVLNRTSSSSLSDMIETTLANIKILFNSSAISRVNQEIEKRKLEFEQYIEEFRNLTKELSKEHIKLQNLNLNDNQLKEMFRIILPDHYYTIHNQLYFEFVHKVENVITQTNITDFAWNFKQQDRLMNIFNKTKSLQLPFSDVQLLHILKKMKMFKRIFKYRKAEFTELLSERDDFVKRNTYSGISPAAIQQQLDEFDKEIDAIKTKMKNIKSNNYCDQYNDIYKTLQQFNDTHEILLEKSKDTSVIRMTKHITKALNVEVLDVLKKWREEMNTYKRLDYNTAQFYEKIELNYNEINESINEFIRNSSVVYVAENKMKISYEDLAQNETKLKEVKETALNEEKQASEELKRLDAISEKIDAEITLLKSQKRDTPEYIDDEIEKYKSEYKRLNKLMKHEDMEGEDYEKQFKMLKHQYELFSEDVDRLNNIEKQMLGKKACGKQKSVI